MRRQNVQDDTEIEKKKLEPFERFGHHARLRRRKTSVFTFRRWPVDRSQQGNRDSDPTNTHLKSISRLKNQVLPWWPQEETTS